MTAAITTSEMPMHLRLFRLAQFRGVLKMEKAGLKGRQGPIRPQIAVELGLKPRAPYDDYIAEVQKRIDALHAENEAEPATA